MTNILHTIILFPFYLLGIISGYFSRAFVRGWFTGFYYIETQERTILTDQLKDEMENTL